LRNNRENPEFLGEKMAPQGAKQSEIAGEPLRTGIRCSRDLPSSLMGGRPQDAFGATGPVQQPGVFLDEAHHLEAQRQAVGRGARAPA
jgi:hypothetical protein